MKKLLIVLLAVVFVSSLVLMGTTCQAPVEEAVEEEAVEEEAVEEEAVEEVTTISLAFHQYAHYAEFYDWLFSTFEERNPDIKIDFLSWGPEIYVQSVESAVMAGTAPDLMGLWMVYDSFAESDVLLDLMPYLTENDNEWLDTITPGTQDRYFLDGKQLGLTGDVWGISLWVNEGMFEEYNLEVPTNNDELLEVAEVFKANGIIPISSSGQSGENCIWCWAFIAGIYNASYNEGTLDDLKANNMPCGEDYNWATDPTIKKWAEEVIRLGKADLFQDGLQVTDHATAHNIFFQGKSAMCTDGTWIAGEVLANAPADMIIKQYNCPAWGGADYKSTKHAGAGTPTGIYKDSPNIDEAIRFLKFFMSAEAAEKGIEIGGPPIPAAAGIDLSNMDEHTRFYVELDYPTVASDFYTSANSACVTGNLALAKAFEGEFADVDEFLAYNEQTRVEFYLGQ